MTDPLVSICLPNLNTRPFLTERVRTILQQTYDNWELIVSDNYSDDGAWEFFLELARSDSRISIAQAPREGMYANWNRCISRAQGEFVYVATSDDTMAADCIEKLVKALLAHPDCDLAHARLKVINAGGETMNEVSEWWADRSSFARSAGPLANRGHVRRAPLDGMLHLLGESVYASVTQLLIRRRLFARIGSFESTWGSLGDFHWNMRAGLVANTIHVADTWGGWRNHAEQATARSVRDSSQFSARIEAMIQHAVAERAADLAPAVRRSLTSTWLARTADIRAMKHSVRENGGIARRRFLAGRLLAGSGAAWTYAVARARREDWAADYPGQIRAWIEAEGIAAIEPVGVTTPSG